MKIDESLFDRLDFIDWLNSQSDDAIVGGAGDACGCPLYEYLRFKGFKSEIGETVAWIYHPSTGERHAVEMPRWAIDYAADIDAIVGSGNVNKATAIEALYL